MQAATIDVLHHEEDLLVALEHLEELRDMLVVQLLHDFHLTLDGLAPVWLHQFRLLVDLHSDFLVQKPVQAETYHSVGTLPDALPDEIVVEVLNRTVLGAKLIISRLPIFEVLKDLVLRVPLLFLSLLLLLLLRLCLRLLLQLQGIRVLVVRAAGSLLHLLLRLILLVLHAEGDLAARLPLHGLGHDG